MVQTIAGFAAGYILGNIVALAITVVAIKDVRNDRKKKFLQDNDCDDDAL